MTVDMQARAGERGDSRAHLQIFASDLHARSLQRAREGLYPETIRSDITPERLKRFFVKENDAYRIRKNGRELVVFTPHNLLKDPPLLHLELIVCRNVLIYLQREVQLDVRGRPEPMRLWRSRATSTGCWKRSWSHATWRRRTSAVE